MSSAIPHAPPPLNPQSLAAKPHTLLHALPLHNNLSFQIKEKILCLELLNIDSFKALSQNPSLQQATLSSIRHVISFLHSKGLSQSDLPRIIGMCPQTLTSSIKTDLGPVFEFLSKDLNVADAHFRKVINKCPRLLVSSADNQLKPCLFYLQRLGFRDLEALAYNDSVLLVSNVENTLVPKLKYLESIGFSRNDAVGMVLRCPGLFTFSIENNFKPKFEFYLEMGRKMEELREFPQYFAFSLEKRIKVRHVDAVKSGVHMPLSVMLKANDFEFKGILMRGT